MDGLERDSIAFLVRWYADQTNGDWEHQYGVEMGTIDNPGWRLLIDLVDTPLEGQRLDRRQVERSDSDWLQIWSDGRTFEVACGPLNLAEALTAFRSFATNPSGDISEP